MTKNEEIIRKHAAEHMNDKHCFIGSDNGKDSDNYLPFHKVRKFLIVPSAAAGLFNGINNFMLGLNSDLGIKGALIFSVGALLTGLLYQLVLALHSWRKNKVLWRIEDSNLLTLNSKGRVVPHCQNWLGLFLRSLLLLAF